jgi:hypothetical protein
MWNRVVTAFVLYSQLYYGPCQSTEVDTRNVCNILFGKPDGKMDVYMVKVSRRHNK